MPGEPQYRLVTEIDAGPVGNVVEHHRVRGAIRERAEVKLKAALRWPRIIRAGNQVAVDRPRRRAVQRVQQCACVAAGQAEADRKILKSADYIPDREHQPFDFLKLEGEAFPGRSGEDQPVDGKGRVVPRQSPQRRLIEPAIAKRGDERQPEAMQESSKVGRSKISHWSIS